MVERTPLVGGQLLVTPGFDAGTADELQAAHDDLMRRYVHASSAANHTLADAFVDSHIKQNLEDLSARYTQLALLLSEDNQLRRSLTSSAKGSAEFIATLAPKPPWKTGKRLLLALTGLVSVTTILKAAQDNAWCVCYFLTFGALGSLIVVYFVLQGPFRRKRAMFSRVEGEGNIYAAENRLFELLGIRKKPEWPVDVVAWFLLASILMGLRFLPDQYYSFHYHVDLLLPAAAFALFLVGITRSIRSSRAAGNA